MALVRRTMDSTRRIKPRVNRAKIDATTEADIRRHMREDDQEEVDLAGFAPVIPPQLLRKQLGMAQDAFARALRFRCRRCAIGSRAASSRIQRRDHF